MAVAYEETTRNQMDLLDVAELYKRGTVVKHEGLFQLSYNGVYNIPVGKKICPYEHGLHK